MSAGAHDPLAGFDATVHAPNRLRVCALLDTAGEAEFGLVQEQLGLSASVLSKHVTVLMDAGYVEQRKAVRDARQRVWLRLTPGAGTPTGGTSRRCGRSWGRRIRCSDHDGGPHIRPGPHRMAPTPGNLGTAALRPR